MKQAYMEFLGVNDLEFDSAMREIYAEMEELSKEEEKWWLGWLLSA